MGFDAYPNSAVLMKPEFLEPLFRSRSFAAAMATKLLLRHGRELRRLGRRGQLIVTRIWDVENDPHAIEDRGNAIKRLQAVADGADLLKLLCDCLYAAQSGTVGRGERIEIRNVHTLFAIWNDVIAGYNFVAGSDLPYISDIESFACCRNTGLSTAQVDFGHPYLAFYVDDVFKQVLTPCGRQLSAALGVTPRITEWVRISY